MDYEFVFDTNTKVHTVAVVGEQYAVGRFLNTEFDDNNTLLSGLQQLIDKLESSGSEVLEFTEWCIEIEGDDLKIYHSSQLETKSEQDKITELEQDVSDIEWDFQSECGKADLIELLLAWSDFIQE